MIVTTPAKNRLGYLARHLARYVIIVNDARGLEKNYVTNVMIVTTPAKDRLGHLARYVINVIDARGVEKILCHKCHDCHYPC